MVSQIKHFVDFYPEYRIVVVNLALKSSKMADWSGNNFVANGDQNIIFLHYDAAAQHFSTISAIDEFVKQMGSVYKWCIDCSSYYSSTSSTQNCLCDLPDQEPKKRKFRACNHCGLDYAKGSTHICFHSLCHSCALPFKTDSNDMLYHRCPIFMNRKSMPGKFNDEPTYEFEDDWDLSESQRPYSLWVYDLESCLVPVSGTTPKFVLDEDGYFEKDGNSLKVIYRQKSKQVPNLVVYKNVFTGEQKCTNNMEVFMRDMLTL